MKKIALILTLLIFSTQTVSAKPKVSNFFEHLKNKPSAQERLAPVKKTYDDELTPSEQATILYNENNEKAALQVLTSIKEADRSAQDWILLGNIMQDMEKNADAIFMYQHAITLDPKNFKAYYNLGNMYLEDDKPFLAIENYRKCNKLNPEFAYGYYNLGCAYLKAGQIKKAKIAFLKAIELKNTVPEFHYNLAYTYKKLNCEKLSKKYLEFYNKLMENAQ